MINLFNFFVYFQSIIFILLMDIKNDKVYLIVEQFEYIFYAICITLIYYIFLNEIKINYYSSHLLIAYITYVLVSCIILKNIYDFKDALCLSFLLVFLNSFYWEFMLHISAFIQFGITKNILPQLTRLIPLPYLIYKFDFTNQDKCKKLIIYGFIVSASINIIWVNLRHIKYTYFIHYVSRTVCLLILLKIFYENANIKKRGD